MVHSIEISDNAFILLKGHKKTAGQNQSDADEMDELFAVCDKVWGIFTPEEEDALFKIVRKQTIRDLQKRHGT